MTLPSTVLQPLPSRTRLIKATLLALVVAAVLLVIAVLPAEYGIDPTGIGRAFGLNGVSAANDPMPEPAATAATPPAAPASPTVSPTDAALVRNEFVEQSPLRLQTSEMQVTLAPDRGAEIKAHMRGGDRFTFEWTASAAVEFDMHGEEVNAAKDVFTSYWRAEAATGAGTFTAPFDGSHGWYWHNHGTDPVTVTVRVSGFYRDLFRP